MTTTQAGNHPKIKPFVLSVSALIADGSGRYLLLKRSPAAKHFAAQWEAPGGKMDPGEPFDAALLREVKEETGLDIALEGAAGVTEFETEKVRVVVLHMRARAVSTQVRLSEEHTEHVWLPPGAFDTVVLCPKLRNWSDLVRPNKEER